MSKLQVAVIITPDDDQLSLVMLLLHNLSSKVVQQHYPTPNDVDLNRRCDLMIVTRTQTIETLIERAMRQGLMLPPIILIYTPDQYPVFSEAMRAVDIYAIKGTPLDAVSTLNFDQFYEVIGRLYKTLA